MWYRYACLVDFIPILKINSGKRSCQRKHEYTTSFLGYGVTERSPRL